MLSRFVPWDYLIVTASNDAQAAAYAEQLEIRRRLKLLGNVCRTLVVADPGGRRIGSGGSTVHCILEVLRRESNADSKLQIEQEPVPAPQLPSSLAPPIPNRAPAEGWSSPIPSPSDWSAILSRLRILIIHAGGDSRRLPAYGPCGKIFVPLPSASDSALASTLFDRQLPTYLQLPPLPTGTGQLVLASGDVLLNFAPEDVQFAPQGITGLGCRAAPEHARHHGVYCPGPGGRLCRFLQKPAPEEQARQGAIDAYGRSVLDVGVFCLDADAMIRLLQLCGASTGADGTLGLRGPVADAIQAHGMDFYREVCCTLGSEATIDDYLTAVRDSGSRWDAALLRYTFEAFAGLPSRVQVLKRCEFLHFGTTRQIIGSGSELRRQDEPFAPPHACLSINNRLAEGAKLAGQDAWVEGCWVERQLLLEGQNVVVGVDVHDDLRLPPRACLDVLPGRNRAGEPVHFVRCYFQDDEFHQARGLGVRLCGQPLADWLDAARLSASDLWPASVADEQRLGWNARLFPAEKSPQCYRNWLWMFAPAAASERQLRAWREADRYSLEEMAALADQEAFHRRRAEARASEIRGGLRRFFGAASGFSDDDLAYLLAHTAEPEGLCRQVLAEAQWRLQHAAAASPAESFVFSRIMHTLGAALKLWAGTDSQRLIDRLPRLAEALDDGQRDWLSQAGLNVNSTVTLPDWAGRAQELAFEHLRRQIVSSGSASPTSLRSALRPDEIVWGRAPARFDLAGGWTDTPPYALEHGGSVLNAAVLLNTQPPIQAFARVVDEPTIRFRSIDVGSQVEVRRWEELLDYASAGGEFSLAKAALVLAGLTPEEDALVPRSLSRMLEDFGGGIELTTLAAIPKGSGLGTSSIMGSVLLAVANRVLGRHLGPNELFHGVLRLEQAMTTGGGWQDQVGGSVGGLKLVAAAAGLVPQTTIRYVPADVLDPKLNEGCTLLYYTGLTRLARNILQQVVGRHLNRDRDAEATLRQIGQLAHAMTEAVSQKDFAEFGRLVDLAWRLNKRLDPNSSTPQIEAVLEAIGPHIHGAKLLGAGGGGFLLIVCRSAADAAAVRRRLNAEPPNPRARFFDFEVSPQGLAVSVC